MAAAPLQLPLRIVFMGTPAFAAASLSALLQVPQLATVAAVVCQPDRPQGRGRQLVVGAVRQLALAHQLPVHTFTRLRCAQTLQALADAKADLFVVAAYGRILPPAVLQLPTLGAVNVHASLLPRWRGASPIVRALLAGDRHTGVTLMQMDAGCDTGGVLAQQRVPIVAGCGAQELTDTLARLGGQMLAEHLPAIAAGMTAVPQNDALATAAPLLVKTDGLMDFARDAGALARQVAALRLWPTAYCFGPGGRLQVLACWADDADDPARAAPGTVLRVEADAVHIACGRGVLALTTVRPSGRPSMAAAAWARGAHLAVGIRMGSAPPVG